MRGSVNKVQKNKMLKGCSIPTLIRVGIDMDCDGGYYLTSPDLELFWVHKDRGDVGNIEELIVKEMSALYRLIDVDVTVFPLHIASKGNWLGNLFPWMLIRTDCFNAYIKGFDSGDEDLGEK